FLVGLGDDPHGLACPTQASGKYFSGFAEPPPPVCTGCACATPSGSCGPPVAATANDGPCSAPGAGTPFDAPIPCDGNCATPPTVTSVRSVTVAPIILNESACVPSELLAIPRKLPASAAYALGCHGEVQGSCPNTGDKCVPSLPNGPWTYCISRDGAGTPY